MFTTKDMAAWTDIPLPFIRIKITKQNWRESGAEYLFLIFNLVFPKMPRWESDVTFYTDFLYLILCTHLLRDPSIIRGFDSRTDLRYYCKWSNNLHQSNMYLPSQYYVDAKSLVLYLRRILTLHNSSSMVKEALQIKKYVLRHV